MGLGLAETRGGLLAQKHDRFYNSVKLKLLVSLPEYLHVLEKSPTQLKLVDPCLALHPVLDAVLSIGPFVCEVKCPEAGWTAGFGVVGDLVVVAHFSAKRVLNGLEIDGPDGTFAQAPVLNGRHLVDRGAKGLLKT